MGLVSQLCGIVLSALLHQPPGWNQPMQVTNVVCIDTETTPYLRFGDHSLWQVQRFGVELYASVNSDYLTDVKNVECHNVVMAALVNFSAHYFG